MSTTVASTSPKSAPWPLTSTPRSAAQAAPIFMVGQVSKLIKVAVENTIGSKSFHSESVGKWSAAILEKCISSLTALDKPFKVS